MKASFFKRTGAYFIDALIFSLIFSLFTVFIPENNNVNVLNGELTSLGEQILNNELTFSVYFNQYAGIIHSLDKEMFLSNLFNFVLIIGYFAILPFYYNGQTLGKKIFKIKVVKDDGTLTMNDLLVRNIIINGLLFSLIGFGLIFIVNDLTYLIITLILAIIEILLVIISIFMILYRHDKKGLHDLWCNTSVVEEK